jgi:pectate lyase
MDLETSRGLGRPAAGGNAWRGLAVLRMILPWLALSVTALLAFGAADAPGAAEGQALTKAKVPAFPGAEGAGAWTPGGRGGQVFAVTNLHDKGPGSLRAAVEAKGPRIVVFRVAGVITLETPLAINSPFITIAGQTAPGDGVCVRGQTTEINTHDVVIRYLRFRRGNLKRRDDALGGNPVGNVIVDHVSASWGLDENLSLYRHMVNVPGGRQKKLPVENLTIQWCISSEALDLNNHAFGGTWGGKNCSFHHNLFACNTGRNPSIGMGGAFDFRNNVLFNWRHRTIDGGDGSSRVNLVANYFKPGPATSGALRHRICKVAARQEHDEHPGFGKWYVADNYVAGDEKVTADNWAGGVQYAPAVTVKKKVVPMGTEKDVRAFKPFPAAPMTQQKAEEAYELVLAYAGATLPKRDAVDVRVVESVRTGKPTFKSGIIDTPADVGGWPEYRGGALDADSDSDGMPDWWEKKYGLDPNDPSDGAKDRNGDGYTNVEKYLNGIDPSKFVDYTRPENNKNLFHTPARK